MDLESHTQVFWMLVHIDIIMIIFSVQILHLISINKEEMLTTQVPIKPLPIIDIMRSIN